MDNEARLAGSGRDWMPCPEHRQDTSKFDDMATAHHRGIRLQWAPAVMSVTGRSGSWAPCRGHLFEAHPRDEALGLPGCVVVLHTRKDPDLPFRRSKNIAFSRLLPQSQKQDNPLGN